MKIAENQEQCEQIFRLSEFIAHQKFLVVDGTKVLTLVEDRDIIVDNPDKKVSFLVPNSARMFSIDPIAGTVHFYDVDNKLIEPAL